MASLAIATGIDYQLIRKTFQSLCNTPLPKNKMISILEHFEVGYIEYVRDTIFPNRVYIVGVPSLNNIFNGRCNGSHAVVFQTYLTDNKGTGINVFDPNKGLDGAIYYKDFSEIPFWFDVVEIVWG